MRIWQSKRSIGLALVGALVAPAAAVSADIYGWRTEDGVYAYTDNRDNIPSRYVEDAVAVPDTRLEGYDRLTVQDTDASDAMAARLERRLDHLRRVNAPAVAPASTIASAGGSGAARIQVETGSAEAPTLDIPTDASGAPIVIEPILAKKSGDARTRRVTLVKQGDRTVAVVMGRSHTLNPNDDIHDQEELIEGR